MVSFVHNKIIRALFYLMFVSAVLHLILLGISFIVKPDFGLFNFFSIIGLNLFYPDFVFSRLGLIVSSLTAFCIYCIIFFLLKNKTSR